jgi:RNA polymerase sigma-70 factor (ECF subfamily)
MDDRDGKTPVLTLVSDRPSALSVLETRRTVSRLDAELSELPERQRSALWLAAVEGHSYEEIAEVLETSVASVKSLVHRARANLADRMAASSDAIAEGGR